MIKLVVFDIDGVLTDGTVSVDAQGTERKTMRMTEMDYVHRIQREGYRIAAITKEKNPMSEYFGRRFPWDYFFDGCDAKDTALTSLMTQAGVSAEETCYIGDGYYDIPALKIAGLSVCPANAIPDVKDVARVTLTGEGGRDCVARLYELLKDLEKKG